jgi:Zn-dependent protease with chaperone function
LARTPKKSKRFDGLAMFCEGHPVLVLGSKRDSPAWLAFHLAHELAHVVLRHVTAGSPPLADTDLMASSSDAQEKEADRAACELLTGRPEPRVRDLKLTAVRLARHAEQQGPETGVDPGVFALIYGRSNDRWPVAQNALKHLATDSGAHAMIAAALQTRLHPEDLPESSERFLQVLSST